MKKKVAKKKRRVVTRPRRKRHLTVRMYNVGFGDCLLLRLPTDDGERRMLVDCGFHTLGKGAFTDKQLVEQIREDLDGAPLDVVVATHRHQDHISGFGEPDLWKDIAVEEVWLPFTARPARAGSDGAGHSLTATAWDALMEQAHDLVDAEGRLKVPASATLSARTQEERDTVAFMLWNARANKPAIENLLGGMRRASGRAAKRRFLPDGRAFPSSVVTPELPGVTTHVLGPPRDAQLRKKRAVPASWGITDAGGAGMLADVGSPFGREWRVPEERVPGRPPFKASSLSSIRQFNDDLLHAAAAVDGYLNGESLVLVLEVGRARLLLPGDAEVGAWTAILESPRALELAASATFLKVGHHGSHNATPLTFLRDHLAKKTPAVFSTQAGDNNYRNGIPFDDLLTTLTDRGMPFVRSDTGPFEKTEIFEPDPDERWIDCFIPC